MSEPIGDQGPGYGYIAFVGVVCIVVLGSLILVPSKETRDKQASKPSTTETKQERKFREWRSETAHLTGSALMNQFSQITPLTIALFAEAGTNMETASIPWTEPTGMALDVANEDITYIQVQFLAYLVKSEGYPCPVVTGARKWMSRAGATLICDFVYEYHIEDAMDRYGNFVRNSAVMPQ